jgi:high-affinity nickel-transport protein
VTLTEQAPSGGRLRQLQRSFTPAEWRRARWMFASIAFLHVAGFGIFIAFVVPGHYKGLGIGVSVLAYTLGRTA